MRSLLLIALLAACGDDGNVGPKDAPPITPDIDNGSCGDMRRFTGELVDWDETEADFCGVFDATVQDGVDGAMDTTAPNGRFDLCLPAADATRQLTVTPPAAASACTVPIASYLVPGLLVATRAVIESGAKASGRMFTEARKTAFFAEMGVAYDPARAQVFVHVDGAPTRVVSLTATHDPAWARSAAWTAGDSGVDVFFPNVAVGAGSTDLAVVGGALGTGAIPLVANTITLVTVH